VVVANRADPDPSGRRPFVVYLFGVAFITLWTAVLGSAVVVESVVQLIGTHQGTLGTSIHPVGDAAARGAVLGGLLLVVSGVACGYHLRRGMQITAGDLDPSSPAKRCARSYVAAVSFFSVLLLVAALTVGVYLVFELAGPGVFGGGGHIPTLRTLLDAAYVAIAAGTVLWWHVNLAGPQLWPWRKSPQDHDLPPGAPGAVPGYPYGPGPQGPVAAASAMPGMPPPAWSLQSQVPSPAPAAAPVAPPQAVRAPPRPQQPPAAPPYGS
jgi:hypothetical protein